MMENPVLQVKCEDDIDNQLDEVSNSMSQQKVVSSEVKVKCEPIDFDFGNDHDEKNDFMQSASCDNVKDEAVECFSFTRGFDTVYNLTNEAIGSDRSEQKTEQAFPSNTDFKMEYDSNIDSSNPSEITIKQEGDDDFNDESMNSNNQDDVIEDNKDLSIIAGKDIRSVDEKKPYYCGVESGSQEKRKPTNCEQCRSVFSRGCNLQKHIRYTCEQCNICFSQVDLKQDIDSPSILKPKRKRFACTCKHCKLDFARLRDLTVHLSSVHKENPYQCEQCESGFIRIYDLERHIKSKHQGKGLSCNKCEKKFGQVKQLKQHILSRHEGKRYVCELCKRSFAYPNTLRLHITTVHGGQQYKCGQCGSSFSKKVDLKQHIQCKHDGEHYDCEMCGNSFSLKESLKRHIQTVHEEM